MFDGFITTASVTPEIRVADIEYNTEQIILAAKKASQLGAKVVVMPELVVTGSTCGDLFFSQVLLHKSKCAIREIAQKTSDLNIVLAIGFPYSIGSCVYNCAAVIAQGEILGIVPKTQLSRGEVVFTSPSTDTWMLDDLDLSNNPIPFGQQVFTCDQYSDFSLGVVIGSDYKQTHSIAEDLVLSGASVILNLDASNDFAGENIERKSLLMSTSKKLKAAYIYANAGAGESTGDVVFGGSNLVAELGEVLCASPAFSGNAAVAQLNLSAIVQSRLSSSTHKAEMNSLFPWTPFDLDLAEEELTSFIDPHPFTSKVDSAQAEYILNIQAHGLAKRMKHVGAKSLVLGVSGGLDSTLALIVCVRACRILDLDASSIHAFSMPGLGTSDRTFNNARAISEGYGVRFDEISIVDACRQHFKDINHDEAVHDVVYENAQARERTQILMDSANAENTFVVGTGDLSELVLGWATYNGDHMSMYGVNASIPKTLVRHLVMHEMELTKNEMLREALLDICETPVSPELLPTDDTGKISQITEDKVGPYVLHDFFIYQTLHVGMTPAQTFKLACKAFSSGQGQEHIEAHEILKWLKVFYQRFFSQQYKRSCMPDGPQATCVSASPRGALMLPTDAVARIWLDEIEKLSL